MRVAVAEREKERARWCGRERERAHTHTQKTSRAVAHIFPLSLILSPLSPASEELKAAWDKSDEKPAIIILGVAALIALTAVNGVVSTVDKIPIFSDLMELVGLVVSGFFAYRYLAFKPDREELLRKIDAYLAKILGK